MTRAEHLTSSPYLDAHDSAPRTIVATSADGACVVVSDRGGVRIDGLTVATTPAVAAAVLDGSVWLVERTAAGHVLHRFDLSGAVSAEPLSLGDLGDEVVLDANRSGARIALIEGERGVLVRDRDGEAVVESLGPRCHRRLLIGGRGIAERIGTTLRLRGNTVPPFEIPIDLRGHDIRTASVVYDGSALLVELAGRTHATALVFDLRRGEIRKRIRLGELRVHAVAERAGIVILGRGAHLAVLDLRDGRCTSERILPIPMVSCAIDAAATRIVVVNRDGTVSSLDVVMFDPTPRRLDSELAAEDALAEPPATESIAEDIPAPRAVEPVEDIVPAAAPLPRVDELAPFAGVHLAALGSQHAVPLTGDALADYLRDTQKWIESMCARLAATGTDDEALSRKRERAACDELARWNGPGTPHVEVARDLGVEPLAGIVMLLVAAPQIWGELADGYRACADDDGPPVDELLLAHLLEADVPTRSLIAAQLDMDAPLVQGGAVIVGTGVRPRARLSVHPAIVRRLAGALPPAMSDTIPDVIGPRAAIAKLLHTLVAPRAKPSRIALRGECGSGRRTLAEVLAARAGRTIAHLEVGDLETLPRRLQTITLRGQIACIDLDDIADDANLRAQLRAILQSERGTVIVRAPRDGALPLAPGHETLTLPPLSETERCDVWRTRLGEHGLDTSIAGELGSRFAIGPGTIIRASAAARGARDAHATIVATIRQLRSARIGAIAERIDRLAGWDQLVVSEDITDALREVVARVRHRRTVLETWGMEHVATTAGGITALFQGGPGTGKTMAAGVIARALEYELWRVDLSKVMSKWIGETEKNLAAVFAAAEEGESVLLFDEADSLFARRTDPKSSNDKHANVVTNYLLQRLDSFRGLAILTTNLGTAIDPAFKRRMSVHVQFPFPDENERERLWLAHLPASLPTSGDLELAAIAGQYQMSGGYIRNVVLRAAYLAADHGGAVTAKLLRHAIRLEKERIGKLGDGRFE